MKKLINVKEIADRTGYSVVTINNKIHDGELKPDYQVMRPADASKVLSFLFSPAKAEKIIDRLTIAKATGRHHAA